MRNMDILITCHSVIPNTATDDSLAEEDFRVWSRGVYPTPKHCEMHVGSEDWQANPDNVSKFGELVGIQVHVVPDGGHNLPRSYVGAILDRWLGNIS